MTKILAIHPGAGWSVSDVYDGLVPALYRRGVEIVQYPLDGRIEANHTFLQFCYRRARKIHPDIVRPTEADAVYKAGADALTMALHHDVDWVFVFSGMFLALDWVKLFHKARVKTAILFTEGPYDTEQETKWASYADVCWTNERSTVDQLRQHCQRASYLPHAWDPARHFVGADQIDVPAHDVVFVGTGFSERIELLSAVDWTGIDFGLYGNWDGLGSRHRLRQYIKGGVTENATTAALYRRAKVNLNLYRRRKGWHKDAPMIEHAESLNPRALELAACGAFTISDYRAEMAEVFGANVPTYKDPADLGSMIRYYLEHDEERRAMAARLPACVEGRTFEAMADQVLRDLQ